MQSIVVAIKEKTTHLVAIVKSACLGIQTVTKIDLRPVPAAEVQSEINSPWYIFNDFMVQNVTEEEALSFPGTWKVRVACQAQIYNQRLILLPRSLRSYI